MEMLDRGGRAVPCTYAIPRALQYTLLRMDPRLDSELVGLLFGPLSGYIICRRDDSDQGLGAG